MKIKSRRETEEKPDKYYDKSTPSFKTVYKWFQIVRSDRANTSYHEHSRRAVDITIPDIFEKMYHLMLDNGRQKACETADGVGIPNKQVQNILHPYLKMKRPSAK